MEKSHNSSFWVLVDPSSSDKTNKSFEYYTMIGLNGDRMNVIQINNFDGIEPYCTEKKTLEQLKNDNS